MSSIFQGSNGRSYELLDIVGEGSFGVVRGGILASTKEEVAIKQIVKVSHDRRMTRRVLRELRVLHTFRHKNIIHLIDVTYHLGAIYLVTELSRIDLFHLIHYNRAMYKSMTAEDFKSIMKQMLDALEFLHFNGILHRDIKPSNVLVNEKMQLHLCDFGLCRKLSSLGPQAPRPALRQESFTIHPPMTEYVVTRWYRAPEICVSDGYYDVSQDIWSAACTYTELITRKPLFPGNSTTQQIQLIVQTFGIPSTADLKFSMQRQAREFIHDLPQPRTLRSLNTLIAESPILPGQSRQHLIYMLTGMLQFNPRLRMTASECLMSTFFGSMHGAQTPLGYGLETNKFSLRRITSKLPSAHILPVPLSPPPLPSPELMDINFDDIECSTNNRHVLTNLLVKEVQNVQRDMQEAEERALASRATAAGSIVAGSLDVSNSGSASTEMPVVVPCSNRALTEQFLYTKYARYATGQDSAQFPPSVRRSASERILSPSSQPTDARSSQVSKASHTPRGISRIVSENHFSVDVDRSLPLLQRCRAAASIIRRKSLKTLAFPFLSLLKDSHATTRIPDDASNTLVAYSDDLDHESRPEPLGSAPPIPWSDEEYCMGKGQSTERDQVNTFTNSFGSTGSSVVEDNTAGNDAAGLCPHGSAAPEPEPEVVKTEPASAPAPAPEQSAESLPSITAATRNDDLVGKIPRRISFREFFGL